MRVQSPAWISGAQSGAIQSHRGSILPVMVARADHRAVIRCLARSALVPAGALAVHQLRFLLAFGGGAGTELARQGHSYLHSLVPWIVLLIGALGRRVPVRARSRVGGSEIGFALQPVVRRAVGCVLGMPGRYLRHAGVPRGRLRYGPPCRAGWHLRLWRLVVDTSCVMRWLGAGGRASRRPLGAGRGCPAPPRRYARPRASCPTAAASP